MIDYKSGTLHHGDCLEVMKTLPDDSVDAVVTDPPYGYNFMGSAWDKVCVSVDIWKECLRVLKPGAFAFIMSAPRQDVLSRMIVNLQDAGFETGFTSLYWTYASGFPKAMNIGKAVDKRYKKRTEYEDLAVYLKKHREEKSIPMKEISKHFPSKTGGVTGCVWNWENGMNVPTEKQWVKLKELLDLDNSFDWLIEQETKRYEQAEREIIGNQKGIKGTHFASGISNNKICDVNITAPATPEALALDGSYAGYQPKPAVEVILCVMKPLSEKSYVDQALANGKGVTWLDDGRIPYESEGDKGSQERFDGHKQNWMPGKERNYKSNTAGRFPANLIVSDNALDQGKVSKTAPRGRPSCGKDRPDSSKTIIPLGKYLDLPYHDDIGGFSRYFSLDQWFSEHLKQLPPSVRKTFPWLIIPKASKGEKNEGLKDKGYTSKRPSGVLYTKEQPFDEMDKINSNFHPTSKPLQLMTYLIMIASRPGDVILDPFLGSGTTALAAQSNGRKWIGIERESEYFEIAKARMDYLIDTETPDLFTEAL